jgi:5-(carboxyamino)imidazole ribonucleotide mutase
MSDPIRLDTAEKIIRQFGKTPSPEEQEEQLHRMVEAFFTRTRGLVMIGIVMGSKSDWETMKAAAAVLDQLGVPYETRVVSAHRTPDLLFEYAETAKERGLRAIVAGAGGAAHLPGMLAAKTRVPVLGVPVESKVLHGVDSLLSMVQMPCGVPVATFAIGPDGAWNAALFAAEMLATSNPEIDSAVGQYRTAQTERVLAEKPPTTRGSC